MFDRLKNANLDIFENTNAGIPSSLIGKEIFNRKKKKIITIELNFQGLENLFFIFPYYFNLKNYDKIIEGFFFFSPCERWGG